MVAHRRETKIMVLIQDVWPPATTTRLLGFNYLDCWQKQPPPVW